MVHDKQKLIADTPQPTKGQILAMSIDEVILRLEEPELSDEHKRELLYYLRELTIQVSEL